MQTSDFKFELPPELIAQHPIDRRDGSRLLCLDRDSGKIIHSHFYNIADLLLPGDVLVLNDSRVIPARIFGEKISKDPLDTDCAAGINAVKEEKANSSQVEFVLLRQKDIDLWECLVKPGKKAKVNTKFDFSGFMQGQVIAEIPDVGRLVKFEYDNVTGGIYHILEHIGHMPLPPYITKKLVNKERYQTVYSNQPGSAAAATAGLHFTPELLKKLVSKGVAITYVTLHVGLGTFRPVKTKTIEEHTMHSEHYFLPQATADTINRAKSNGNRVIATGTTACRVLETAGRDNGTLYEYEGDTDIFIYPGYDFKVIDGLITNFHLPESTLIMLTAAFAGYKNIMNAYQTAVGQKYRFFSFGDAMLIL
ncbi:MAG: tRNA preQ1(34) S-adenosylmethionine ribosyltransferase-isomerase QueA [Oscillospiraceae bacterium]|nr:tRNA preQ1(34) S-adenosylmethionine ribosyltransferase-isomerase QueA [Oscillospiraceae bacterium]